VIAVRRRLSLAAIIPSEARDLAVWGRVSDQAEHNSAVVKDKATDQRGSARIK
jgi:hypothetical protein